MKKTKKFKPQSKAIKELAAHFEEDFKKTLPISIQPDGSIVLSKYVIKKTDKESWGLYNIGSDYLLEDYYLKTCALLAAKAYSNVNLTKFFEIKHLDSKYWANFSDLQVYKKNIKTAKDFERFCILLNKLEHSEDKSNYYQAAISKMFKYSFV